MKTKAHRVGLKKSRKGKVHKETKRDIIHDIMRLKKKHKKMGKGYEMVGSGKHKSIYKDKKATLKKIRNEMMHGLYQGVDMKAHKAKKHKGGYRAVTEKKRDIIHDIAGIIKKLDKRGVSHEKVHLYKDKKATLLKVRKGLEKLLAGNGRPIGTAHLVIGTGHKKGGKSREEAIMEVNEYQPSTEYMESEPYQFQPSLEDRDALAARIRSLESDMERVIPGSVGYYHTGGARHKKAKLVKCPKCGSEIMVGGTRVKSGIKNPNKKPHTAKANAWQNLVKQVAAMPQYQHLPRSEIMKIASKLKREQGA